MKHIKFRITPGAYFAAAFLLYALPLPRLCAIGFAAAVHEAGHIIAMLTAGGGVKSLTVRLGGLELESRRALVSYPRQIAISLAGAAANIAVWAAARFTLGRLRAFMDACIVFAILNLLPIPSLDGGEALAEICAVLLPEGKGECAAKMIGYIFLFLLWILAVYVLLYFPDNPSLFILCACLFAGACRER